MENQGKIGADKAIKLQHLQETTFRSRIIITGDPFSKTIMIRTSSIKVILPAVDRDEENGEDMD